MSICYSTLHERARTLLTVIDDLEIEKDLRSSRQTLDDWRTEMISLVEQIYLSSTHRLDSLKTRLEQLKQNRAETLRQEILPNLNKILHDRTKAFPSQQQKQTTKKLEQIDQNLQVFGSLLSKIGRNEKKLIEQIEVLKSNADLIDRFDVKIKFLLGIQRENLQLISLDSSSPVKQRFKLDTGHSPYLAISDDDHLLIEDDNHLVLYDGQRRINEIPWEQGDKQTFTGAIKDIVYSNYLQQFCVLSALNFFTFDVESLILEKSEQLRPSTGNHFQSVACVPNKSEVYFALTTSGSRTIVERWSLVSGSLIRRWYHDVFESDDRLISSIRANEKCLAVCIKQQRNEKHSSASPEGQGHWRVDLFDMNFVRMYRGVHLKVGGLGTFVTPFDERSWLVINGNDIWLLGEQAECVEEKKFYSEEKLLNVIVKNEDIQGNRQFILKLGQPAELRVL